MQRLIFGAYTIDIDAEKNRIFYRSAPELTEGCQCVGCRNFAAACAHLPPEVLAFFDKLGIDPAKPAEVYDNIAEDNGKTVWYGGFYHLCGEVISGESAWIPAGQTDNARTLAWDSSSTYEICRGYQVSFQRDCALLEENFPTPAIQMEIEFHVPWVLDEPNSI